MNEITYYALRQQKGNITTTPYIFNDLEAGERAITILKLIYPQSQHSLFKVEVVLSDDMLTKHQQVLKNSEQGIEGLITRFNQLRVKK